MTFNPTRKNRGHWWATWNGEEHAIVHFKCIDWKTLSYKDSGAEMNSTNVKSTPRGRKVNDLIQKTGIVLVQHNGDGHSSAGWHSAWSVTNVRSHDEIDGWVQFDLAKRLA
jgi:hypothetical protein